MDERAEANASTVVGDQAEAFADDLRRDAGTEVVVRAEGWGPTLLRPCSAGDGNHDPMLRGVREAALEPRRVVVELEPNDYDEDADEPPVLVVEETTG